MKRTYTMSLIALFSAAWIAFMAHAVKASTQGNQEQEVGSDNTGEVLRIITWEGYIPEDKVKYFQSAIKQKYGREVKLELIFAIEVRDFFNAIRGQNADLSLMTHNQLKDERWNYIKKGLIIPVNLDNVPNHRTMIPYFKNLDYYQQKDLLYSIPFIAGSYGLYYDAKVISSEPNWSIFWDNKYKGNYAISYENYETNVYVTLLGLRKDIRDSSTYQKKALETAQFQNRLKYLAVNADHLYKGNEKTENVKDLAFITGYGAAIGDLKRLKGKDWRLATPSEGSPGFIDGYSIGYSLGPSKIRLGKNKGKRDREFLKVVAEEWLNFTISPEYQVDVSIRGWASFPVNQNVRKILTTSEIDSLHLNDLSFYETKIILFPILSKRTRNSMDYYWKIALESK